MEAAFEVFITVVWILIMLGFVLAAVSEIRQKGAKGIFGAIVFILIAVFILTLPWACHGGH